MGLNSAPVAGGRGGVAVTYSLSTSAQVELTVLSLTGKPIRRLPQAAVSIQGLNNTTWDGRDASGRTVPAGTYLIELTARTDIGEVAKTAVPVVMR
jgi:flagellar basal-body rod modification protein FlgD